MKRFFAILLSLVLVTSMISAYADEEWTCSQCNTINDTKFCGECGSRKPVSDVDTMPRLRCEESNLTVKNGESISTWIYVDGADLSDVAGTYSDRFMKVSFGQKKENAWQLNITGLNAGVGTIDLYLKSASQASISISVCVTMSDDERQQAESVCSFEEEGFFLYEEEGCYILFYSLKNKAMEHVSAPSKVDVRIISEKNIAVYEETHYVTTEDFTWWLNEDDEEELLGCVYIFVDDIATGTTKRGTVYFSVSQDEYFSFENNTLWTSELPANTGLTAKEEAAANSVEWISDRDFFYYKKEDAYVVRFCFKDSNEQRIASPCTVEVRLVNSAGEEVYSTKKQLDLDNDFSTWTWSNEKYADKNGIYGSIYIRPEEIKKSTSENGTMYIRVYLDGWWDFAEKEISIDELPVIPTTLSHAKLPIGVMNGRGDLTDESDITCAINITNITYEVESGWVEVYLTGEVIAAPFNSTKKCMIAWRLKDSEGYVVDSGAFYTDELGYGEKFKNLSFTIYNVEPGAYTLQFQHTSN